MAININRDCGVLSRRMKYRDPNPLFLLHLLASGLYIEMCTIMETFGKLNMFNETDRITMLKINRTR